MGSHKHTRAVLKHLAREFDRKARGHARNAKRRLPPVERRRLRTLAHVYRACALRMRSLRKRLTHS